jgi:uncharacterized delta-60 repeat protein
MLARSKWGAWTSTLRNLFRSNRPAARRPLGLRLENLEQRDVPTAGLLDTTFGTAGKTVVPFDLAPPAHVTDQARAFTVQADGKIVIVGSAENAAGDDDFAITRLNADGTLDKTFNKTGKQTVSFKKNATEIASAVAIQADGKIVVAGSVQNTGLDYDFGVTRLNTDGTLDTTFGIAGLSVAAFNLGGTGNNTDIAQGVAIQADGKIVVAGSARNALNRNVFAVDRLNSNGYFDTTFGVGGKQTLSFTLTGDQAANAVAIQADGRIVAAGVAVDGAGQDEFAVARLDTAGAVDPSFGTLGKVLVNLPGANEEANALAIQADGKIVVVGNSTQAPGNLDFAAARLNTNGTLDTTFNKVGYQTVDFNGGVDFGNGVALQKDGKILIGGQAAVTGANTDFGVTRLNPDGTLDATFGTKGKATVAFDLGNNNVDYASGVALQADGRIVLAGTVDNKGAANQDFAATRLTADNTTTGTGGTGGTGTTKTLNFDKLGAYRPTDGSYSLDSNGNRKYDAGVDVAYTGYAPPGAIPVAGNWMDGADGRDKIGYFLNGMWHLDVNGDGKEDAGDLVFKFGDAGDTPVVGKWDGKHVEVGVFTTRGTFTGFIFDTNGSHDINQGETHVFGFKGDRVVVGDWNGDGKTKIGVFRPNPDGSGSAIFSLDLNGNGQYDGPQESFVFGAATDGFIVGDWNGDGKSKLGVYRSSPVNSGVGYFTLDSNGDRTYDSGDEVFEYGLASDRFIAGNWAPPPGTKATVAGPAAADAAFAAGVSPMDMMM